MRWLFLLFCTLPVIELIILLKIGNWLGVWPTVALILGTAFIGVNLLRQQGIKTFSRANQRLAQGEMPAAEMVEGIVLAIGGALLLTPGLVTDVIGFSCLLPGTRHLYIQYGMRRMTVMATRSVYSNVSSSPFQQNTGFEQTFEQPFGQDPRAKSGSAKTTGREENPAGNSNVIEGEYERKK
jgi:UPF0716 protein FxsA